MIKTLRKNIGIIVAVSGFALLTALLFGNIFEITTEQYWQNVKENLTSIGLVSISLTMIQLVVKQGLSEQALQKGLNADDTKKAYNAHKKIISDCTDRMIYLPYFLQIYNEKHTQFRRQEFLVDNNYSSEEMLRLSKKKRLIRKYEHIHTCITPSRIKWATTEIKYNKKGQIETLAEHRIKRTVKAIIYSAVFMLGTTLLTKGLFFGYVGDSIGKKFAMLGIYLLCIILSSVLSMIKEYEKGAFGVCNELQEINEIWKEFKQWIIPEQILNEIRVKFAEVNDEESENSFDDGTNIQEKSTES